VDWYLPSSVISVVTFAFGHRCLMTVHRASSVSASSLSDRAHVTGWPACYTYMYAFMFTVKLALTIIFTISVLIWHQHCQELKPILVCFVRWVQTYYSTAKSTEERCLEAGHDYKQKCVCSQHWQIWIFNTLWFVVEDRRWCFLLQLLHNPVNWDCILLMSMFAKIS